MCFYDPELVLSPDTVNTLVFLARVAWIVVTVIKETFTYNCINTRQ